MENKPSDHFPVKFKQETKASLHFSLDIIIFSKAGFKIIGSFIFHGLMFALWCSFFHNETLEN